MRTLMLALVLFGCGGAPTYDAHRDCVEAAACFCSWGDQRTGECAPYDIDNCRVRLSAWYWQQPKTYQTQLAQHFGACEARHACDFMACVYP